MSDNLSVRTAAVDEVGEGRPVRTPVDLASMLLGENFRPGGPALLRRLATAMTLSELDIVLDTAARHGSTALLLAAEFGASVIGIAHDELELSVAAGSADSQAVADRVLFQLGDDGNLPIRDASVTAVVCEHALHRFADEAAAVSEMTRVLRAGGRVGVAAMTLNGDRVPSALGDLRRWIPAMGGARPAAGYHVLLEGAGLTVELSESHDDAMANMFRMIGARLPTLAMIRDDNGYGMDVSLIRDQLTAARAAADAGAIGCQLIVARKPAAAG